MKLLPWRSILLAIVLVFAVILCIPIDDSFFSHQQNPRKQLTDSHTTCYEIATAIEHYYAEYKAYPPKNFTYSTESDTRLLTDGSNPLIATLLGKGPGFREEWNPREIYFLSLPRSRVPGGQGMSQSERTGLPILHDRWNHPLCIVLDTNNDGQIDIPSDDGVTWETVPAKIGVWCAGIDGRFGRDQRLRTDDIFSCSNLRP